jgi:undecaprenyl-diphosphatase
VHKVIYSQPFTRSRTFCCTTAWILAIALLSVVILGILRYEPVMATRFDWPIVLGLNDHVSAMESVNRSINAINTLPIVTGALLVGLVCYFWFSASTEPTKVQLLLGLGAVVAAVMVSRGLQVMLPTHLRPLHDPALGFNVPPGIDPGTLNGWSSFPSDHACLLFALTTVIWRRSRLLGAFGLLPALLGSLPRIYLGYHYPSDILFGAALGIFVVVLVENYGPRAAAYHVLRFERRNSGMFYFLGFLLCYEVSTLFDDVRRLALISAHAAFRLVGL